MAQGNNIRVTVSARRPAQYPWQNEAWLQTASRNLQHLSTVFDNIPVNRPQIMADLNEEISRVVTAYPQDFAPFEIEGGGHRPASGKALNSMRSAISNWFKGIKVVEEEETTITREFPLCVFNCPNVPMARTTFSESDNTEVEAGWTIDVLGTGFGSNVTLAVSQTNTFRAAAGECKLVFAPVPIRVVKVALYKRDVFQKRFLKAEVANANAINTNGLRSLNKAEWQSFVEDGRFADSFDLSKNTGTELSDFDRSYKLSGSFDIKVGFDAFTIKSSISAKCTAEQEVSMTLELPPGRLYELWSPATISGFYFK